MDNRRKLALIGESVAVSLGLTAGAAAFAHEYWGTRGIIGTFTIALGASLYGNFRDEIRFQKMIEENRDSTKDQPSQLQIYPPLWRR